MKSIYLLLGISIFVVSVAANARGRALDSCPKAAEYWASADALGYQIFRLGFLADKKGKRFVYVQTQYGTDAYGLDWINLPSKEKRDSTELAEVFYDLDANQKFEPVDSKVDPTTGGSSLRDLFAIDWYRGERFYQDERTTCSDLEILPKLVEVLGQNIAR